MEKVNSVHLNVREILKPYFQKWLLFPISIFLMVILAIYFIKSSVPIYKTQSTVLIKDAQKMSSASGDFGILQSLGAMPGMGTSSIENEMDIFKSKSIIEDVLKTLNFQTPVYSKHLLYNKELYGEDLPVIIRVVNQRNEAKLPKEPIDIQIQNNTIKLRSKDFSQDFVSPFDKTIRLPFADIIISKNKEFKNTKENKESLDHLFFTYDDFDGTVDSFQKGLQVKLSNKEGTIIELSLDYPEQQKARIFLNKIILQYNLYAIEDKNIQSKRSKDFIDERINLISRELGDVETQKEKFKSNNNIVDLTTEAKMNLQLKEATKGRLLEIDTQLELNKDLQKFLNKKNVSDVLPVNIGLNNETATKGILEYNELVIRRNKLLENATHENPLVKEVENQLILLKSSVSQSLSKNETSLDLSRKRLFSEMGSSEGKISQIPFQEKLFRNIERQQQIKENLYLILLQKREEAAITMAITSEKARVIDKAYTLKKPVSPKKIWIMGIALALGFIIPFLYIFLKVLLNNKIERGADLAKQTQIPLLAELPRLGRNEKEYIEMNDISQMAEAYRILVTNLKYMLPVKDSAKIVLVTSSVKGEGKTFVSVNLSLALASKLNKVLIIGSDIRNPQLQRFNTNMKNAVGLSEYLYGEVQDAKTIIHPSNFHSNCDFIYSGSIPPNPAELLENGRYEKLVNEVSDLYNYIILDTAPLMLVTDTLLISQVADATVYVLRSEFSEKEFVDFAESKIRSEKIKKAAFVLNDVHSSNLGYGNKYGYGYHADTEKWWKKLFNFKRNS